MESDSDDDSQMSQPQNYFMKEKTKSTETIKSNTGVDVVDRATSNLISFDASSTSSNLIELDTDEKAKQQSYKPSKSPTDKLLMKSSSESDEHLSDETSLGEEYEVEDDKKFTNKSQQTSPTLFADLNAIKSKYLCPKALGSWNDIPNNYGSSETLESPVHSPEIASFQSKYLKNLCHHQRSYFDGKQSIESLNTRADSKLELESRLSTRYESRQDITATKRRYGVFNFEFNEELFYEVKRLFPQVSDDKIRTFMFKHCNQEHDVIAATINSLSPKREKRFQKHQSQMDKVLGHYMRMHKEIDRQDEERRQQISKVEESEDRNYSQAVIKIKYLKLLYPAADFLQLFYLLYNCDMKSNVAAKKLEELGFERASLNGSEESLSIPFEYEELMPDLKLTFGEQQERVKLLKEGFPLIDDYLVKTALESCKFNLNEARKLLDTVDIDQYKNMKSHEYKWSLDDSNYVHLTDRSTQTCHLDYFEFGRAYKIERKKKSKRVER